MTDVARNDPADATDGDKLSPADAARLTESPKSPFRRRPGSASKKSPIARAPSPNSVQATVQELPRSPQPVRERTLNKSKQTIHQGPSKAPGPQERFQQSVSAVIALNRLNGAGSFTGHRSDSKNVLQEMWCHYCGYKQDNTKLEIQVAELLRIQSEADAVRFEDMVRQYNETTGAEFAAKLKAAQTEISSLKSQLQHERKRLESTIAEHETAIRQLLREHQAAVATLHRHNEANQAEHQRGIQRIREEHQAALATLEVQRQARELEHQRDLERQHMEHAADVSKYMKWLKSTVAGYEAQLQQEQRQSDDEIDQLRKSHAYELNRALKLLQQFSTVAAQVGQLNLSAAEQLEHVSATPIPPPTRNRHQHIAQSFVDAPGATAAGKSPPMPSSASEQLQLLLKIRDATTDPAVHQTLQPKIDQLLKGRVPSDHRA